MASEAPSIIETRRAQMFPTLDAAEIERLRRFATPRSYPAGAYLSKSGEVSPGMFIILSGKVEVMQRDPLGHEAPIVSYGPGAFMAELAVLSGNPALVDGVARSPVEALVIPTPKLRQLMVEEAELGERIMRAMILRRMALIESGLAGPIIIGRGMHALVLRLENYLTRNGHPHHRLDPDDDGCAKALIEKFHVGAEELPIVLCPNGQLLRKPDEHQLAQCLGLIKPVDFAKLYDLAIVGAGPAGLAAAVYGASEGLSVIMLDCNAFGGQAGASMRIENYLGFPTGITGMALMGRAYNQAQKFGTDMSIPNEARHLGSDGGGRDFVIEVQDNQRVRTRSVIIATGARYRRLDIPNLSEFEGSHVHYWASPLEGQLCAEQEVALVGAGNSAGQAAVYLATKAAKVYLLMRGLRLEDTMSHYLVERIAAQDNIEVLPQTEVTALVGQGGVLDAIRWRNRATGEETARDIRHLFLFIGAEPNTAWLRPCGITLDAKGFVLTNAELGQGKRLLETSRPGIFAIGDVRSGSVKRVASAVGEGAQVIATLHTYLAERGTAAPP